MPNTYGQLAGAGLYTGLSPKDALAKWYAIRQKPADQQTQEEKDDIANGMTGLQQQNPGAWDAVRKGVDSSGNPVDFAGGQTVSVFDPQTGTWSDKEEKSAWHDPETWAIMGAAAGLGGAGLAAGLAGGAAPAAVVGPDLPAGFTATAGAGAAPDIAAQVAAETAAGGGGGAVTTAATHLPSWLSPVIGAGSQLGGAAIQSHATSHAADVQAQTAAAALAYEKERDAYARETEANRYGAMTTAEAPYVAQGGAAASRMGALLGLPQPSTKTTTPTSSPQAVWMKAPDGSTKQVPADQEAHYTQLGATRLGG